MEANLAVVPEVCCSCSKKSLCKIKKCECQAAGSSCSVPCGCAASKCNNRVSGLVEGGEPEILLGANEETERSRVLASHGVLLLQSALSEKPTETKDDCGSIRKPLSDIANTLLNSDAPKPNQKKKWRKSVLQLVPVVPRPENAEASQRPEGSAIESDIPLKLPRGKISNNNTLKDKKL